MDYSALDDAALMSLVAGAQTEALSELYDRYARLVFSLALSVVQDHVTAEEITLDVFTRLWQKAGTYEAGQARLTTWLVRITRNRAIDVLRQRRVRPDHASVSWADMPGQSGPSMAGPEETAELAFRRRQVRAALAQLPADQQQVLALAYFDGYTHRQIAEVLDQPLGTVKTRIRLAMQKLRHILQNDLIST